MKKILLGLLAISSLAFATPKVNVAGGIETSNFPSLVTDVNVEFENKTPFVLQVGNQLRFEQKRHDWSSAYVGVKMNFSDLDFGSEPYIGESDNELELHDYLQAKPVSKPLVPVKKSDFWLLTRVGLSSDLDSTTSKGYGAFGVQYGQDKFVRVLLESENHKLKTSLTIGTKLN